MKKARKSEQVDATEEVQSVQVKVERASSPVVASAVESVILECKPIVHQKPEREESNGECKVEKLKSRAKSVPVHYVETPPDSGVDRQGYESFFGIQMTNLWEMYVCSDHDCPQMLYGASTVVFAHDEAKAREYLSTHLVNHGRKSYDEKHFTLTRIPFNAKGAHLVCVSYQTELLALCSNAQKRLTGNSEPETGLDSGNAFAHNHAGHRLFIADNIVETIPMRCGAVVIANSMKEAEKLLVKKIQQCTRTQITGASPYQLRELRASDLACAELPVYELTDYLQ